MPRSRRIATALLAVAPLCQGCLGGSDDEPSDEAVQASGTTDEACAPLPPRTLSWNYRYESKLWINGAGFNAATCAIPAGMFLPFETGRRAAYKAFCKATGFQFRDTARTPNPFPGGINANLDARIYGRSDATWTCTAGNPLPTAGRAFFVLSRGGFEAPPGIFGTHNVTIRNTIAANGTWGFVTFGRPNALLEPVFLGIHFRNQPNIWNHYQASLACTTDANGVPGTTIAGSLTATRFPSHKLWRTNMAVAAAGPRLIASIAQGPMAHLWSLPPVPPP